MPVVMVQAQLTTVSDHKPRPADVASPAPEEASALEDATLGLVALGYRKSDAGPRARRALEALQARREKVTSETLLEAALR
jgi:Holliday junction resolvasome RuvABC DNA-binding subunit